MTEPRRFGIGEAVMLLAIVAAAAGARSWYLCVGADYGNGSGPWEVQDERRPLALPPDTEMNGRSRPTELDVLIHNLKEHRWFGSLAPFATTEEKTAHVAPGYPWLLSLLQRSPIDLGPTDRTVRWIQGGLGSLTAGFYFLFALAAFRSRLVAILAGLFCALHPFWIINTAEIDDGVLTTFLLGAALFLGASAGQTGGPLRSLLYGLSLAGLTLVRAALLPFAFVAVLWFLLRCRSLKGGWLYALVAFLGFLIGIAPWTVRNLQVMGDPIPIVDSTYLHLWMGNNSLATGGPQDEAAMLKALAESRGENPRLTADDLARIENQKQRYTSLSHDVWKQVQDQPARTLRLRLNAGLYFLLGENWFTPDGQLARTVSLEDRSPPGWLSSSMPVILQGTLLGMLVLAGLGWRWTYGWRKEAMPSSLALIWVPLPYFLSHAEGLSGPRLPLDGVLLCYAAFALACLIPGIGGGLFRGASEGERPSAIHPHE